MTPLVDYIGLIALGRGYYHCTSYRLYPHCTPLTYQWILSAN